MKLAMLVLISVLVFTMGIPDNCEGEYIIGEGDTLYISVWGEEELSLSVKVRPDGKITIPALGDVAVAGIPPRDLQVVLEEKLKQLIKKPVATVIVQEITNNKVYVFGGGVKSGVFNLDRRTTLLQLLCQIGDVNEAELQRAYVLRNGEKVKADFYKLFIEGDTSEDIMIEPDDVVFIPALADKNVYVVGAVNAPMTIKYREGLTVMEAILQAGGFTKFAKKNATVIFRKNGEEEVSIPVKLKKLIGDGKLDQNVRLKAGDYIVVKEGIF
jgi:polysaccharide export outer membrane protein